MFIRTGLFRLARPATNTIGRRSKVSVVNTASGYTSGSLCSPMLRPMRSISSSPVLGQSATALATEASFSSIIEPVAESTVIKSNEVPLAREDPQDIMKEYEELKSGSALTPAQYESFLERFSRERSFDNSYKIYQDMKTAGVPISATAYGYIFLAGRRGLRISEVREIFGQKLVPRTRMNEDGAEVVPDENERQPSYFFTRMMEVRESMLQQGLELETWFWDDCATWLASINHAGLLINLAIAQETRGITPSTKYYSKMLYTLPRCGFSDRADLLFSRMVLNGIADESSYIIRLGSLVYMGRYEEAEQLFTEMETRFTLNQVAYNTIINGYLQARQPNKAFELFEKMKTMPHAPPTTVTAGTLINFFYETGKLENANSVLSYFKETINYPSNSSEQASLLKFYGRYEPAQANRLIQELVKANPNYDVQVYNALFKILTDNKVQTEWKRNIGETALDKLYPIKTGGLAELAASLPYHIRHLISRMEAFNVEPDAVTFDIIMRSMVTRKEYEAVKSIYQMMPQKNINIFSSHHNAHLAAMILGGTPQSEILQFIQKMKTHRWPISSINGRRLSEASIQIPAGAFVYKAEKIPYF